MRTTHLILTVRTVKPMTNALRACVTCKRPVPDARVALGYETCLICGEKAAKQRKHTIVPMHKSNYTVITSRAELLGINNKGGLVK